MTTMITRAEPLRLVVVDDHPVVRDMVRHQLHLEPTPRFRIVGEAGDIPGALAQIEAHDPHLAVIDVILGRVNGLMLARVVRERYPDMRVLIWSHYDNAEYVAEARAAGVRGYVLKCGPTEEIVRALETVAAGASYYSAGVDQTTTTRAQLTLREMQVLRHVACGRSSRKIARLLRIDRRTVEGHRQSIMLKLDACNAAEMLIIAIRRGLLDVHDFTD